MAEKRTENRVFERKVMTLKTTWKYYAIMTLAGILFAGRLFAQEGKFQATVFLIGIQQPAVIQDFTLNDDRFYDAVRQGKQVKLPFRDIKEIRFLNPGNTFETEILLAQRHDRGEIRPIDDDLRGSGQLRR
jgi:hypothetical protein